jgi:hypothetical protein
MFEDLMKQWMVMQQVGQQLPTEQAAQVMAQNGDPNMFAPLFADTKQWSPLMPESDPLLNPQPQGPMGS